MSEAELQAAVIDLARRLGWLVYHTHDSRRSPAGFPDLVCVRDRVIYIELKTEKGGLSEEQSQWLLWLDMAGAEVHTFRTKGIRRVQHDEVVALVGEPGAADRGADAVPARATGVLRVREAGGRAHARGRGVIAPWWWQQLSLLAGEAPA
jgi:hypothetical protein